MTLKRSKIFLILCLGFIGGVFLGKFISLQIMAIAAIFFIILLSLGYKNKIALVIGMAGLISLVGAWRFQQDISKNDLAQFYGQKISGTGVITTEPDVRPDKVFLTVGSIVINNQKLDSKALFYVQRFPGYEYGQEISFEGKLVEPKDAEGLGEFSYKNYLSRYGIAGLINYPKVEVKGYKGNFFKSAILNFKHKWTENLSQLLPEPQNAFLGGLLLGAKRSIPQDLIDAFSVTGTSHIIAVSGYNITIIAWAIDWLLQKFFRKRISFILSILAIGIFVIMTGASASVVRAGIMGALLLVAKNIGRIFAIANALALAAVVMLVINPQILHFDIGFQLSFAALLGLVYITPLIEKYFRWIPKFAREYFVATLSAEIATLPILLLNFGILSLVAPVANVLTLPAVPITMLFGFLAGSIALILPMLAMPFVWIAWIFLTYIIKIVELLASLPYSSLNVHFTPMWLTGYYILLLSIIFYYYKWKERPNNF